MIKLSKRLLTVASFIRENAKIVDIGCDHALLDLYLIEVHPHLHAIAVDIKEGAINQARQNIEKYNIENAIDVRLGDGLDVVGANEIDTIVISGLGCPKIIDIISHSKEKLSNVVDIIIQSNTDYYDLRKATCSNGYYIEDEKLVKENNIIYLIIHFTKGQKKYSEDDYFFGPCLRLNKDELFRELINNDIRKKEILYDLIPQDYVAKKRALKINISKLREEIK
jgi:tRNA (adenine22-N1)-methyltransferase